MGDKSCDIRSSNQWPYVKDSINNDATIAKLPSKKCCTPSKNAWRGHYCCVLLCRNSSSSELQEERKRLGLEKLLFHCFPDIKPPRGKEWIVKIRQDIGPNFIISKSTRICSAYFKPDDFFFSEFDI